MCAAPRRPLPRRRRGRRGRRVLAGESAPAARPCGRRRTDRPRPWPMRAVDGRHQRRRRDRLLVERSESLLVQRGVDRPQGRKQTFVIDRFRRVANADHHAVGREQSAAAAADDRLPGHLQVPGRVRPAGGVAVALLRGIEETIERIDLAVLHGGIVAVVAADARHRIAGTDRIARRGDAGNHHRTLRPEGHQSDVAFQVVGHQPAGHADGRRRTEDVDFDLARAFGVAEEVSAGEHEGLAAGPGVDDRAAAAGVALRIFHAEPNAGGQHGRVADRRLLRRGRIGDRDDGHVRSAVSRPGCREAARRAGIASMVLGLGAAARPRLQSCCRRPRLVGPTTRPASRPLTIITKQGMLVIPNRWARSRYWSTFTRRTGYPLAASCSTVGFIERQGPHQSA